MGPGPADQPLLSAYLAYFCLPGLFRPISVYKNLNKKNPGAELLSRTRMCSTIVARPLIDRVRDGNVSYKPAMDTGKKGLKMLGLCRIVGIVRQAIE